MILNIYNKLAVINVKLQEPSTAQEYLDLHRKNFGYSHPRTEKITEYMVKEGMEVGY